MPHINRIRVNNVKYNFGTQVYDDFVLRLSGKNTIYDLANGGGKSVLMLLLMQNMLPNCTLDEKQPIEKLFRSGNNNTVIHSLVEWRLNDSGVKNQYKYMTTGFCARKALRDGDGEEQEAGRDTASIEYFNYCIFYREFNANDIVNLPLSNDKERITYNGLKAYLRDLEKKDYSLEIKLFDRKGDYQRFIAQYGIYESEWEIIRGINKTEGHVRTYFETNYKTTRKVVEDMFIDEIIRKSFRNKILSEQAAEEDPMAQTLIDIKDKLVELSKKKSDIQNYDRQTEVLLGFAGQTNGLEAAYTGREDSEKALLSVYGSICGIRDKELKERETLADRRLSLLEREKEVKRQAETVQISIEEARAALLAEKLKEQEENITAAEEKIAFFREDLKQKESANDYLDYIGYREERDKLKELLDNVMKDKGELSELLSGLAASLKTLSEKELARLSEEQQSEEQRNEKDKNERTLSEAKERELYSELAVTDSEIASAAEREKALQKELMELRSNAGLLLGADISGELKDTQRQEESQRELLGELTEKGAGLHDALVEARVRYEKINDAMTAVNARLREATALVEAEKADRKRIDTIKAAYEAKSIKELAASIELGWQSCIGQRTELENKRKRLSELLTFYDRGLAAAPSKEQDRVQDYLERCYGYKVHNGGEYLLALSDEERARVLSEFTMLPFGLVVEGDLELLSEDDKLCPEERQEYPVPLFSEAAVRKGINSGRYDMLFPTNIGGWYIDSADKERELKDKQALLRQTEAHIERLKEQEELLREERSFINRYAVLYGEREDKVWEDYERVKAESDSIRKEREEIVSCLSDYEEEVKKTSAGRADAEARLRSLQSREDTLHSLIAAEAEHEAVAAAQREAADRKGVLVKRHKDIEAHIEALSARIKAGGERLSNISEKINRIISDWDIIYKPFLKEGAAGEEGLDYDTAAMKFAGVKSAFDKEYAGVEDKLRLLSNYEAAMAKAQQTIAYNGADEAALKAAYESHSLVKTDNAELLAIRERFNHYQGELRRLQKENALKRDEKSHIEGSVAHGIKAIIEKYGVYEETDIEEAVAPQFVNARREELKGISAELSEIEARFKEIEQKDRNFEVMKKDLERIFKADGIEAADTHMFFTDEAEIQVLYEKHTKEYEKLRKDIYARREDFERSRQRLIDMLNKLNAYALAKEVRDGVETPLSAEAVRALKDNIAATVECIGLEKDRILRGITDMQAMKDSFENQCLQTCANIKLELDKLSKLSTIRMDDEVISIIGLQIPYVKEEFRKEKMERYIDGLVEQADKIDGQTERLKYIKNGLAWKRLFSVIVTDMNAIRLNLYKRERIKEQSRYLRYEEAVGSTGQSQGIYIQFLIGVINYISNINSPDAQGGLRKVIFIDNPFGAAKDIYIWEPIFKLLKTNNVQLIVPARGATPAITGRFDVNYVLGQKLADGRQQTVVVDYFSSVERDELEYKVLDFEQTTLQL